MNTVLQIILNFLKIGWKIYQFRSALTTDEKVFYDRRLKGVADLFEKIAQGRADALDEDSYLSNLQWEQQTIYNNYKKVCSTVLLQGGGWTDVHEALIVTTSEDIIAKLDDQILAILNKPLTPNEKSELIAKLVTDVRIQA